jgi:hypothetical protein
MINSTNLLSFNGAFTSNYSGSTFITTAIPEPSTLIAAFALAGFFGWLLMRRLGGKTPHRS